jgi:hypothetical protein
MRPPDRAVPLVIPPRLLGETRGAYYILSLDGWILIEATVGLKGILLPRDLPPLHHHAVVKDPANVHRILLHAAQPHGVHLMSQSSIYLADGMISTNSVQ